MSISDAADLKKLLKALGFEVYRTSEGRVLLAERVRNNLIMDSGVAVGPVGSYGEDPTRLRISVTLRAQASHFPGANVEQLRNTARALAAPLIDRGYDEEGAGSEHMLDPADHEQILDTSHEVRLGLDLLVTQLEDELRRLLATARSSSDD